MRGQTESKSSFRLAPFAWLRIYGGQSPLEPGNPRREDVMKEGEQGGQTAEEGAGDPGSTHDAIDDLEAPAPETTEGAEGTEDAGEGDGQEGGDPAKKAAAATVKKWLGRYETPEELEQHAYESRREGQRLHKLTLQLGSENKRLQAQLREALERKQEVDSFKKLSDAEVKALRESNPADYADYIRALDKHESRQASEEKRKADEKANSEREEREIRDAQRAQFNEMLRDTKKYPSFRELEPMFDGILELMPGLAGQRDTFKSLFIVAKGIQALKGERAAAMAGKRAKDDAAAQAKARAGIAGTTGEAEKTPPVGDEDLDDLNKAILSGARKQAF